MSESAARPAYATIASWCALTGMGTTATYEALARGDLEGRKIGRRTLINTEHGLRWIASLPAWSSSGPVARRRR